VPAWAAVLIALSQPIGFVGELAGGPKALAVSAQIAFALGLIPVGIRLLGQSDVEWESEALLAVSPPSATLRR